MHLIAYCAKNSKLKLKYYFSRLSGFKVLDQNSQNIILINDARTSWYT